jgi:hypothetical protein
LAVKTEKSYDSIVRLHTLLPLIIGTFLGFMAQNQARGVEPTPPSTEQTTENILALAVQSIGGRKELNKINSFQLHGVIRLPDGKPAVEVDLATKRGGKVLGILTYIGVGQSRFGSDGTTAWEQKLDENNEAIWELINDAALSRKVQQTNWLEWFTMLPNQINSSEFVGEGEFDGEDCWRILVKNENENEQIAFFSKTTHRPRGRRTVERTTGGDVILDVYFRNWEHDGKLLLFHEIVFSRDDHNSVTLKLDSIVLDKAKDELFVLPDQIIKLRDTK